MSQAVFERPSIVLQTGRLAGGIFIEKFDRDAMSSWAWDLIARDFPVDSLSLLANEANVLAPSELAAILKTTFIELGLLLPENHETSRALWLLGELHLAWHNDLDLEQSIYLLAGEEPDFSPLYYVAHGLIDLSEMDFSVHDPKLKHSNRSEIVRMRCNEWVDAQSDDFFACLECYDNVLVGKKSDDQH